MRVQQAKATRSPAYDVELKEPGFKEELFTEVIGSQKASWKSIAPGANVSHTLVLKV